MAKIYRQAEDGAETDLDLGHYERFIGADLSAEANATSGRSLQHGHQQGTRRTVPWRYHQVVPHVTDEIKRTILACAEHLKADVLITEIGGTVGDIEGQPFIEAIRQMDVGRENVLYVPVACLTCVRQES